MWNCPVKLMHRYNGEKNLNSITAQIMLPGDDKMRAEPNVQGHLH